MDSHENPPPYEKLPPYNPESAVSYPPGYNTVPASYYPTPTSQYGPAITSQYGQAVTSQYGQAVTSQYGPAITSQSTIPTYGAIAVPANTTIIVGGCPACRMGVLQDSYPCSAICLAVFCFPLCGICCCLAMKQRRCSNCGAKFT